MCCGLCIFCVNVCVCALMSIKMWKIVLYHSELCSVSVYVCALSTNMTP